MILSLILSFPLPFHITALILPQYFDIVNMFKGKTIDKYNPLW